MMMNITRSSLLIALAMCAQGGAGAQTAQERLTQIRKQIERSELFDFGKVRPEDPVEHTFQFRNAGAEPLEVKNIQLTAPLSVISMPRAVPAGGTASIVVRLGQPRNSGQFEGIIVVHFKKEDAPPGLFRVQGRVVRPIDFEPFAAFFITTFKGEPREQAVEITNYETKPLSILKVEHDSRRFTAALSTLEPGKRYKLSVTVKDSAPAGKASETITLMTSSEREPAIRIPVNTQVRERVYAFPDSIALGRIETARLKERPADAAYLSQTAMIYQRGGADFQISVDTDVPFLSATKHQARLKDRYEVRLQLIPEKLRAGAVKGSVRITTNDPAFPAFDLPVTGEVTADW